MKFNKPELPHLEAPHIDVSGKVQKLKGYLPNREPEPQVGPVTRILHDLGLAVWFGGSIFGILSLNPSVEVLDDPEERGKMVDEAWARFQPYGALGMALVFVTNVIMRRKAPRKPTSAYNTLALLKDFFVVGSGVTSVAALALGEYAVDDYSPVDTATEPNEETDEDTAKAQSGLTIATIAQLTCGIGLIVTTALLAVERDKSR